MGYTVDLVPETGTYNGEPYDYMQTNIRYNHLAIVDEARAGPEARIALDGEDAVLINKEEAKMASKKLRKVKIDAEEYMLEDDAAEHVEKMMAEKMKMEKEKEELERKIEELHNQIDRTSAERDSLRDKDYHDPKEAHEFPGKDMEKDNMPMTGEMPMAEKDEIGPNGKEKMDPIDTYGMQSHVRDYEKTSQMKEHVVSDPKNRHYPHDLPHIAKVDHAEFNRRVKERVRLEKLADRYLDKSVVARLDGLSEIDIKKRLILNFQKTAVLDGRSDIYINARFDSILEQLPREKVIAMPSRYDSNADKENIDANQSRMKMIARQHEVSRQRSK